MMFSYEVDRERLRLVTVWTGDVTMQGALEHIENRAAQDTIGYAQLIDATGARVVFSSAEAGRIAQAMKLHAGDRPLGPTAFLVSNDCDFGMYRLFGTLADDAYVVNVFRSRHEALRWLGWEAESGELKAGDRINLDAA